MNCWRAIFVAVLVFPAFAQYSGPAILSRGEAPSELALPEIRFLPYASVAATYDSGLTATVVGDNGQLASTASYGYSVAWGVSGNHRWRHTQLGMDYSGSVNQYAQHTTYNSINQSLLFSIGHQFTKHIYLTMKESAGIMSRNYTIGGLSETVPFDPSTTFIPRTDFFDNRTIYATSSAALTIQKSNRLSFNLGGQGFTNNRQSHSLTSAWGIDTQGDVQYRLSRKSTIGVVYNYMHFGYSHFGGGTDAHALAGAYSVRLSRRWEASGFAGFMRVESKFIQAQSVDPVIAALLGITQSFQIRHTTVYSPSLSGRLSRSLRRGVLYVSAGRSITPGNGLFLTSIATSVLGGYSSTAFRHWSLNAQIGYMSATSEGNIDGRYGNTTETVAAGRQLTRHTNLGFSYTSRVYSSLQYANYNRRINTASVTLGFSPGEVRLPAH